MSKAKGHFLLANHLKEFMTLCFFFPNGPYGSLVTSDVGTFQTLGHKKKEGQKGQGIG